MGAAVTDYLFGKPIVYVDPPPGEQDWDWYWRLEDAQTDWEALPWWKRLLLWVIR
jgi:hypothetical protein